MSLLSLPAHLCYYLYTGHADMRRTFEGLCGLMRNEMEADLLEPSVFPSKLAELKEWAEKQLMELNHKAAIAEACRYRLKRWDKLIHYTDGRMLPDTNLLEGRFCGPAVRHRNWLFAGRPNAAPPSFIPLWNPVPLIILILTVISKMYCPGYLI